MFVPSFELDSRGRGPGQEVQSGLLDSLPRPIVNVSGSVEAGL